mgnify:CR=1 FL=1
MSQNEPITQESKTIRLPARTYYKVVELASLVALVRGESTSISEVLSSLIDANYQYLYPWLMNVANNPKLREQSRNDFRMNKKTIEELMKDIRLTE